MPSVWSNEQKRSISSLYKIGRKIVNSKSHVDFLSECLERNIIPKAFHIKCNIPGNKVENVRMFRDVSQKAMVHEKESHQNAHDKAIEDLANVKEHLMNLFSESCLESELKRFEKHLSKIEIESMKVKTKKLYRDSNPTQVISNSSDVTLAIDDVTPNQAHNVNQVLSNTVLSEGTLVGDDAIRINAHNGNQVISDSASSDVTLADDDVTRNQAHKERRRFKRVYN